MYLQEGAEWEFSSKSTMVQANGSVDLETFLNILFRGLPKNSQSYRKEIIHPSAYCRLDGRNCACTQLSECLGLEYDRVWAQLGELLWHAPFPGTSITLQ